MSFYSFASNWHVTYALFSKSGFTPDLAALAQDEGILLVGPAELVAARPDVASHPGG